MGPGYFFCCSLERQTAQFLWLDFPCLWTFLDVFSIYSFHHLGGSFWQGKRSPKFWTLEVMSFLASNVNCTASLMKLHFWIRTGKIWCESFKCRMMMQWMTLIVSSVTELLIRAQYYWFALGMVDLIRCILLLRCWPMFARFVCVSSQVDLPGQVTDGKFPFILSVNCF